MLIELSSAIRAGGDIEVSRVYQLAVQGADFQAPQSDDWKVNVKNASFGLEFSEGSALKHTRLSDVDLPWKVATNSGIVTWDTERRVLRDPLRLLNSDHGATDLMKQAQTGTRFIFLFGGSYASSAALMYFWGGIPSNVSRVDDQYLHVRYTCHKLDELDRVAKASAHGIPVIVYYVSVRFDSASEKVILDPSG
jgi:hypothetical protein